MAKIKHKERAHTLLSASGANRWLNCTPSARLEEGLTSSSSYAREGTLAHEFCELFLRTALNRISLEAYTDEVAILRKQKLYNPEMEEHAQAYSEFVLEEFNEAKHNTPDAKIFIEKRIDLTPYVNESFGTVDAVIIADGTMKVIDFKYGKGVSVDAENNPQLKLYGLGALHEYELAYDIHTVELVIFQPRIHNYSSWEIEASTLRTWGEIYVKPRAEIAFNGEGEKVPGAWCRWCKVSAKCKALADQHLALAQHEFKKPDLLSDEELLQIFDRIESLIHWAKSVHDYIFETAVNGKKWPGLKLVEGQSKRKWADPDLVIDALIIAGYPEDKITDTKLKAIGKIAKLMSVDKFQELLGHLVVKPQGSPKLVPETDKRPPYVNTTAVEDFKENDLL